MNDKTAIGITAILTIGIIEGVAICNHIDGIILTATVGAIVGIFTAFTTHEITKRKYSKKVKP